MTDKTYTGRHLPPRSKDTDLPELDKIVDLWRRDKGNEIPSKDTSILFAFFAQWFTDSFLRTNNANPSTNFSNHEIDFCQLYGQTEAQTNILRSFVDGKLKSQQINGQEFPPYLFDPKTSTKAKPKFAADEFALLHSHAKLKQNMKNFNEERAKYMFATGLEHGNTQIGYTVLSVVFLREHNRICDILKQAEPDWTDERLFDTTRAIMTVLLLNIILGEYVAQVGIMNFPFAAEVGWAEKQSWYRNNWINIEFSLLYRWHSMVPDRFKVGGKTLRAADFRRNPQLVVDLGVEGIVTAASQQTAGRIGLKNTHDMFFAKNVIGKQSIQEHTLGLARRFDLAPMNDYRRYFGLKPINSFEELVGDRDLARELSQLYASPDDVELMVGLFGEKHGPRDMMGDLMVRMVAFDAFTHALTNPLLSKNIYGPQTFGKVGLEIIETTKCLRDIVARNVQDPTQLTASFQSHQPIPGHKRFAWFARIWETIDFAFVRGLNGHFRHMVEKHRSTVFRSHALRSRIVVADAKAFELFTDWDGQLCKEHSFGVATAPKALTGGVTPTVFQDGQTHDDYKALYARILAERHPDTEPLFRQVLDEHTDQWVDQDTVALGPAIEHLTIDFLFRWFFDVRIDPADVSMVYNNIFGHSPRWFAKLNPLSKYHQSKTILDRTRRQIVASDRFKTYAEMAKDVGLHDEHELCEQLMFLVGMNSYLGLQSLFKSIVGEINNNAEIVDELRKSVAQDGPKATSGFVMETLRLHPPVFFYHGVATKDFILESTSGQFNVAKGERIMGLVPFVQRTPEVFADPDVFDPSRPDTMAARRSLVWAHARHDQKVSAQGHGCPGKDPALHLAGQFTAYFATDIDWQLRRPARWATRRYSLNVAAPVGELKTLYFKRVEAANKDARG